MWEIDVVSIMKEDFIEKDKDCSKYGWLPKMTTCSKGSIGSLLSVSFCDRINSYANQVPTFGNSLLCDSEMEKLVLCRMNEDFIVCMRKNYPEIANEQFEFEIINDKIREKTCFDVGKIGFCHCAAVLQTHVPKLCTDLDLGLLYILASGTYSKFARRNKFLALGVCSPQPCSSAGRRFVV